MPNKRTEKIKFKIIGMHCTACAINIDGDLEDAEGVSSSKTNYARSVTEIEYDPDRITISRLTKIIEKTGYKTEAL